MQIFVRLHREGRTVLLITHEDEIAAHTRRVVVLRDGRIVEDRRLDTALQGPVTAR